MRISPPLSILCICLFLAISADWRPHPALADDGSQTIRLLSDDAADRCIQDQTCMQDLFLQATLGGEETALLKSVNSVHAALFGSDRVPADLLAVADQSIKGASMLAMAAGADFHAAKPGSGAEINLMLMVSDDFARDREQAFGKLLNDIFAGNTQAYDDLAASPSPICQSRLYADNSSEIAGILALAQSGSDPDPLKQCIHRLALNALGLRHPLNDDVDSVLNPESPRTVLTAVDFLLLKLLYDPVFEPGMTSAQLTEAFPEAYARLSDPPS